MNSKSENSTQNATQIFSKEHKRGKIAFGLMLIGIGSFWMAKEMGVALPQILFHWSLILILLGFYNLIKHGFSHSSGYILVLIGSLFLLKHAYPDFEFRQYIWPIVLIVLGIFTMFQPWTKTRRFSWDKSKMNYNQTFSSSDSISNSENDPFQNGNPNENSKNSSDYVQIECILSGSNKTIHTENFKGGDISVIMGGAEVNLSKSVIQGKAVLNLNAVMGGIEIICPPDWKIENHVSAILGGVTDKRWNLNTNENSDKVLVLLGSAIMGGIEIR